MSTNSNLNSNIKIYGKVRPPLQHEIYASTSSAGSASEKKLKTQSSKSSITYPKQSSLFQDYLYSFYCPEFENNQRIVYLKNPVKGKLLEKSFKIENETRTIQELIPEVSGVFELDKCYGQNANNSKIYSQTCKKLVVDALNGKNGTVITMGPTSGGKAFLLRGDETKEKGIILQYIEDLVDGNEISRESGGNIYNFRCSIYGIYQNNIIDFLSPKFKENLKTEEEIDSNDEDDNLYSEREIQSILEEKISSVSDFKHLYRKSMNNVKLYSNQFRNNEFKNDCHMIVSIINERQNALPRESRTCVNFVRLASTDNLVERKSVREDLKILLRHLLHVSAAQNNQELSTVHQRCRLTQCLVPALNEISNIALFICISPALRSSEGSIYSIEFAHAIYQEILTGRTNPIPKKSPFRSTQRAEETYPEGRSRSHTPHRMTETFPGRLTRKRSSSTDDFNSLYDLYNKTRESIKKHETSIKIEDHSMRKKTTENSEEDDSLFGIEGEMTNLKKEIYAKIEEVIEESLNPPISNDPTTERYYNETLHAKRNLKQIKKSMEHKELLEREAMKTLREKEKRAKDKVRNYRERLRELEELIAEKDKHIEKLEESVRESKKEIKHTEKKIVNFFEKEEQHHMTEDQLSENIDKLRRKLISSKEKYRGRLAILKEKLQESTDFITKLEHENFTLRSTLDEARAKSDKEHATLLSVQEDLNTFKGEFEKQEKIINIMKENTTLQDKMIDDLKTKVLELTRDNEKLLYDRENLSNIIGKEREKGENVYDNLKKLQNQSLRLEQRNAELEREILTLKRDREGSRKLQDEEVGRLYQQLTEIKKELDAGRYYNEELQKQTLNEDAKRDKQIREFQAEAKVLYQNVNEERKRNKELIEENTRLVEQSKQKLALIDKYERQLDRLGSEQGNQIVLLEGKIEELLRDIQDLKRDNSNLRETEMALLRKLDIAETSRQELYVKCSEYKADNRVLKENLREIDEKMKKLLYQNNVDLKVIAMGSSRQDFKKRLDTDP